MSPETTWTNGPFGLEFRETRGSWNHTQRLPEVSRVQGFREERIPQEGPWRGLCNKTFVVNEVII